MNILYLFTQGDETVNDRLFLGLTRDPMFELGTDLFAFPYKPRFYDNSDNFGSCGLPFFDFNLGDIIKQLQDGFFDLIFVAHPWGVVNLQPFYSYILSFFANVPVVIINQTHVLPETAWSSAKYPEVNVIATFSSEKYHDWDDYPISYSMREEDTCAISDKQIDVFWAGTPHGDLRKIYILLLQSAQYGHIYSEYYPPGIGFAKFSAYLEMLRQAKVSFGFPGSGFHNNNRMIEGAGQAVCMLIHDYRDIIEVRDDFTDNENAIFFKGAPDLIVKLESILNDEEKLYRIAKAGYEHIMHHHLLHHCVKYVMEVINDSIS